MQRETLKFYPKMAALWIKDEMHLDKKEGSEEDKEFCTIISSISTFTNL